MDHKEDLRDWTNRLAKLCTGPLDNPSISDLIQTCSNCERFFRFCCVDNPHRNPDDPCHNYPLIITDGSCLNNGHSAARSGIGICLGTHPEYTYSIPIDDTIDPNGKRSNQRAELLAAILGIEKAREVESVNYKTAHNRVKRFVARDGQELPRWVVATDSQYVVKGMTEWLPKWKVRPLFVLTTKEPNIFVLD